MKTLFQVAVLAATILILAIATPIRLRRQQDIYPNPYCQRHVQASFSEEKNAKLLKMIIVQCNSIAAAAANAALEFPEVTEDCAPASFNINTDDSMGIQKLGLLYQGLDSIVELFLGLLREANMIETNISEDQLEKLQTLGVWMRDLREVVFNSVSIFILYVHV